MHNKFCQLRFFYKIFLCFLHTMSLQFFSQLFWFILVFTKNDFFPDNNLWIFSTKFLNFFVFVCTTILWSFTQWISNLFYNNFYFFFFVIPVPFIFPHRIVGSFCKLFIIFFDFSIQWVLFFNTKNLLLFNIILVYGSNPNPLP